MCRLGQHGDRISGIGLRTWSSTIQVVATLAVVLAVLTGAAQSQTYNVIHNFTGGQDGATPMAGLTMDESGNLYGTAAYGGTFGGPCGILGCGTVFRLTIRNGGWVLTPLYSFTGGSDGANPVANVTVGADGSLYGSTYLGGGACAGDGCGTIFNLKPPASACKAALCPWNESVIHRFARVDGEGPAGAVLLDPSGDVYGTTIDGGGLSGGTVFELLPSGGGWMGRIIYNSYGYPGSGVLRDHSGNLDGTAFTGGNGQGSIYQLVPAGSGWIAANLYNFTNGSDGGYPVAGLILDQSGNLYGSTSSGGAGNGGTVFQLAPSNGNWILNTLYSFTGPQNGKFVVGPVGSLAMDQAGVLYGTALADGAYGYGSVFKLIPGNDGWTYISLHDFTGGSDGGSPYSNLVFDAHGNLYGTTSTGGADGLGVVFEIKP